MVDLEKLRLELITQGYQYDIYPLREVGTSQDRPNLSISTPGTPASDNILIGIQGQQAELPINFILHDDGTDKSNGTAPAGEFADDTVVTIMEQVRWLEDYIQAASTTAEWTIDHATGERFNNDSVAVESMDLPTLQRDSPKWHEATLRLRRGGTP